MLLDGKRRCGNEVYAVI